MTRVTEIVASSLASMSASLVTPTFLSLIVVVFAVAYWRLLRPLARLAKQLGCAQRSLAAQEAGGAPVSLIENLRGAVWGIEGDGLLRQVRLFEMSWRMNSVEIDGQRVSSVDSEAFFDPALILPPGFQWNIIRLMPGILTTTGILGTFVGISLGLAELQKGFQVGADFGPMQEGVLGLMGGMSTAFWTSIFGILFSLLWTTQDRRVGRKLAFKRTEFLAAQSKIWPTTDPDTLWRYAINIAEDQRASLKTLATDIASNLVDGLNKSIIAELTPEVAQMREAIEKATSANSEIQVEGMERMVERFGDLLGERMKEQFENLANTIEMLCEWQRQTKENLDQLLRQLEEASVRQSEMMQRSVEAGEVFQRSLGELAQIHERLSAALSGFEMLTSKMNTLSENVVKSEAAIEEAAHKMVESLSTAVGEFGTLSGEYRKGFDQQLRSIDQLVSASRDQAQQLDERLRTSMEKFAEDCRRGVEQTFSEFDKNLSQLASGLSGTVQEIEDVLRRTHGNLDKVLGVSEDVNGASQGLRDGVAAFRSLVDGLNANIVESRSEHVSNKPAAAPEEGP